MPEPSPGQLRVRVRAAPTHAIDLHIVRGQYGFTPESPAVLGLEPVGVVDTVRDGVDAIAVGQRVITMRGGTQTSCGNA